MKLFFHHTETDKLIEIDVKDGQSVKDLKVILEERFRLDTSSTKNGDKKIFLGYGGSDLNDDWVNISTLS